MVTASLCNGGEGISGGGPWLSPWAEISAGLWMVHSNVVEKIKFLDVIKTVNIKMKMNIKHFHHL